MKIKLKHTLSLFILSFGTLLGMMFYYDLDWSLLTSLSFYEDIANPSVKVVKIGAGLRKEEIADYLTKRFAWNEKQKENRGYVKSIHKQTNESKLESLKKQFTNIDLFGKPFIKNEVEENKEDIKNIKLKYILHNPKSRHSRLTQLKRGFANH